MLNSSRRVFLFGLAAWSLAPRAHASIDAAALYRSGAYLEAASTAEAAGGADDLAFAARALLALYVTEPARGDADALIARAQRLAERALALDRASVPARLQLAGALGMRSRRAGIREVIRARLAQRGKHLIEEAVAAAPREAWAQAMLGGWHLEALRRGGRWAQVFYGARLSEGLAAFDRARALAPGDPAIAVQYGAALLALDAERYGARAADLFEAAGACRANDALGRHLIAAAARINAIIASAGPVAAQRAAARTFP